jgi:hypothetical protein
MRNGLTRPSVLGSSVVSIAALLTSIAVTDASYGRQPEGAMELSVRVAKVAAFASRAESLHERLPRAPVMAWVN